MLIYLCISHTTIQATHSIGFSFIGTHGDTLTKYSILPPKGQVASSNLAWDTNIINDL